MKKTEIINIRVLADVKEVSRNILYNHDLDHSKGIRHFLNFLAEKKTLPADLIDYIIEEDKKEEYLKQFK